MASAGRPGGARRAIDVRGPVWNSIATMSLDLTPLLDEWPYEPGQINVRVIRGEDGEPRIQVRLDLGVLQMRTEGRPDGLQPDGYDSLLELMEERIEAGIILPPSGVVPGDPDDPDGDDEEDDQGGLEVAADASAGGADDWSATDADGETGTPGENADGPGETQQDAGKTSGRPGGGTARGDAPTEAGSPESSPAADDPDEILNPEVGRPPGPLTPEECAALRDEARQYYHRYVAFLILEDFEAVLRDTTRNLRLLDVFRSYAKRPEDRAAMEQFRPYVLMMRTRALASQALAENEAKVAVFSIDQGLEQLRSFFESIGRPEVFEQSSEVAVLRGMREALKPKLPVSQSAELRRRLAEAVGNENYELAAILRDELRMLGEGDSA